MKKYKKSKNVVIIGRGGHAHVIADIIVANGDKVIALLDYNIGKNDLSAYLIHKNYEFIIGIGDCDVRRQIAMQLDVNYYTAVHPSAIISPSAIIGAGTVVMPNTVINAQAKIGRHCIINTGAIVEHNNILADFVHVSVGVKLGGTVNIGQNSMIGIGATVSNNVRICENCIIGAGAVVVKEIENGGVYAGIPAKLINKIGEK